LPRWICIKPQNAAALHAGQTDKTFPFPNVFFC
jgi:hypothetical protein